MLSSCIFICFLIYPVLMLDDACQYNAVSPVLAPTIVKICRVYSSGVDAIRALQMFERNPSRTTSPKTTFRLPFNDSNWRRLLDTNRFEVEVAS